MTRRWLTVFPWMASAKDHDPRDFASDPNGDAYTDADGTYLPEPTRDELERAREEREKERATQRGQAKERDFLADRERRTDEVLQIELTSPEIMRNFPGLAQGLAEGRYGRPVMTCYGPADADRAEAEFGRRVRAEAVAAMRADGTLPPNFPLAHEVR